MTETKNFKTLSTQWQPSASLLEEQLRLGWECFSIALSAHGFWIVYLKKTVNQEEPNP